MAEKLSYKERLRVMIEYLTNQEAKKVLEFIATMPKEGKAGN